MHEQLNLLIAVPGCLALAVFLLAGPLHALHELLPQPRTTLSPAERATLAVKTLHSTPASTHDAHSRNVRPSEAWSALRRRNPLSRNRRASHGRSDQARTGR